MEGHELEEESIQEGQKINHRHKPALSWASRSTEANNHRLKAKLSEARRVINLQNRTWCCFYFGYMVYLSFDR